MGQICNVLTAADEDILLLNFDREVYISCV